MDVKKEVEHVACMIPHNLKQEGTIFDKYCIKGKINKLHNLLNFSGIS